MRYLLIIAALFCSLSQIFAQNNITYGAGISYTNGAPSFVPPARTSRVAIDTVTGKWYHFNTPGGWQLLGNTIEEIAGCSAPAYTPTKGDSKVVINNCAAPELYYWTGSAWVWINEGTTYYAGEGIRIENDTIILDSLKLNELHDVFVPNPINNQVLTWDNIDKRWEAKTVADSSATNELQTLSVAANTATLSSGGGSVTIAGAGINTVGTAGTTITVTGTEVDGSVSNELQTLSTGTNTLTLSNGGGTVTVDTDPSSDVTGSGTSGQVSFWTGAQTQGGDNGLWWDNSLKRLGVGSISPTAPLFVKSTGNSSSTNIAVQFQNSQPVTPLNIFTILDNGNVGLGGQTSPTSRLDILGGLRLGTTTVQFGFGESGGNSIFLGSLTNHPYRFVVFTNEVARFTTGGNFLIGNTTGTARLHVVGVGSTGSTWTAQFHNSAGNNNALMIRDDGNVGIATNNPTERLQVSSSMLVTGSESRLKIGGQSNTFLSGEFPSSIYMTSTGGASFPFTTAGHLVIQSRANGTQGIVFATGTGGAARMYIEGDGDVGINTSAPAYRLDVNGTFRCTGLGYIDGGFADEIKVSGTSLPKWVVNNSTTTVVDDLEVGQLQFFINDANTGGVTPTGNISMIIKDNTVGGTYQASIGEGADMVFRTGIVTTASTPQTLSEHMRITKSGNVGIGTATPNVSAKLEINSTTQGVLFPRMTTTQRNAITTPADGLVIYNTTDNKLQVRAAGVWVDLH